jgi:hypothetical protein
MPLANANVSLIPEDGNKWNAARSTDASGVVKLYGKKKNSIYESSKHKFLTKNGKTRLPYLLFFLKSEIMGRNSFRMISNRLVVLNEVLQLKACL